MICESNKYCDSLGDSVKIEYTPQYTEIIFHKGGFSEAEDYDVQIPLGFLTSGDGHLLDEKWGCCGIGVP